MRKEQISRQLRKLVIALVAALIAPAFAQKAEIEAVNAKWIDFFNKGDFTGVASLYTEDATAFPPGSGMVKGRAAIEAALRSARDRDLQPQDQGPTPQEVTGKYLVVWEKIESEWKLAADIWNDGK